MVEPKAYREMDYHELRDEAARLMRQKNGLYHEGRTLDKQLAEVRALAWAAIRDVRAPEPAPLKGGVHDA